MYLEDYESIAFQRTENRSNTDMQQCLCTWVREEFFRTGGSFQPDAKFRGGIPGFTLAGCEFTLSAGV
jgi:hypothetical protein